MTGILEQLRGLSTAEDFFTALDVPYEQQIVSVNRLHILKRMQTYMRQNEVDSLPEDQRKAVCKASLERAYADFTASNAVTEKVFKVFQDAEPAAPSFVSLDALRTPKT